MTTLDNIAAGIIGGLAGGLIMEGVMLAGQQTGMIQRPLPQSFERAVAREVGVSTPRNPTVEQAAATGMHMLTSAALGAAYGLLQTVEPLPALPTGPLFGLGVFGLMLVGVGPALGAVREPWHAPAMGTARRLFMHVVYGTVTAEVFKQVSR